MFSSLLALSFSLTVLSHFVRTVPLEEFYTFSEKSEESNRRCLRLEDDDYSEEVIFSFTFFGIPFDSLYVRYVNF